MNTDLFTIGHAFTAKMTSNPSIDTARVTWEYKTESIYAENGRELKFITGIDSISMSLSPKGLRLLKESIDKTVEHMDSDLYSWACNKTGKNCA